MKISSFLIAAICLFYTNQCYAYGVYAVGKCPTIPNNPQFDKDRYKGTWYNIANLPNSFQAFTKCSKAEYGSDPEYPERITVRNTGFNSLFNSKEDVKGYAVPYVESVPNRLNLKLKPTFLGITITESDGDYNVVDVDYSSYSIVYTCKETDLWFFTIKEEFAFILSRSKNLTGKYDMVKAKLAAYTDVSKLNVDEQTCDN